MTLKAAVTLALAFYVLRSLWKSAPTDISPHARVGLLTWGLYLSTWAGVLLAIYLGVRDAVR